MFFFLFTVLLFVLVEPKQKDIAQVVFYSIPKHNVVVFNDNKIAYVFGDSAFFDNEKLPFYYLRRHLSNLSLRKIERVEFGEFFQSNAIWTDNFHVQYKNLRGLIVKEDFEIKQSSQSIPLHFCLLSKEVDLKKLLDTYEPKTIISDNNLSYYSYKQMKKQCKKLGLNYHDLR